MRRSALSLGSSRMSWSHPTPVRRSAIAFARAGPTSNGCSRASTMTKSLPRPCILSKRRFMSSGELRSTDAHGLDHLFGETIHFLGLGTHLEQKEVEPGHLIFLDPL